LRAAKHTQALNPSGKREYSKKEGNKGPAKKKRGQRKTACPQKSPTVTRCPGKQSAILEITLQENGQKGEGHTETRFAASVDKIGSQREERVGNGKKGVGEEEKKGDKSLGDRKRGSGHNG